VSISKHALTKAGAEAANYSFTDDRASALIPEPMATSKKIQAKVKPASGSNGRSVSNGSRPAGSKVSRKQAAANALASVRAEGLDPGVAEPLLDRWAREEITDAQLDECALRIAAGESLTDLLGSVRA
jgi:hypothetical protein